MLGAARDFVFRVVHGSGGKTGKDGWPIIFCHFILLMYEVKALCLSCSFSRFTSDYDEFQDEHECDWDIAHEV